MGAFAWISQLIEWFGSLVPRIRIIRATHGGVKFRRGSRIQEIKPGLIVYWPIVTEIEVIPVARQTHNLPTQCAVTKDKVEVTLGGVVVYSIRNVVKALSRNWDFNDTLNDITLTAMMPVIMRHTYDDLILKVADESIQKELTVEVRRKLRQFGIGVQSVGLTDFSKCMVIKSVGGQSSMFPYRD